MKLTLFASQNEAESNKKVHEKFELVSCPQDGRYCKTARSTMNAKYAESIDFRKNKEFEKSIDAIEIVYEQTMEMPESPCSPCVAFYRSTIVDSVAAMHKELKSMSKGLFATKRYESSCKRTEELLDYMKKSESRLKKAI